MRGAFQAGIIAALMSLVGCGQSNSYDPWAGDRKTANPPPKPPNCPRLPELANVTRDDGKIIDVRIIQIGEVKFYVPGNWNRWPETLEGLPPTSDTMLGLYDPDINAIECPGVVHKWVSKRAMFDLGWRFAVRRSNAEPWVLPNFTLDTKIDSVSIRKLEEFDNKDYENSDIFDEKIFDAPPAATSAYIFVVPRQLIAIYPWPKSKPIGSPQWVKARSDMIGLVDWLRTQPNMRDNDHVFYLGAD